jgi:transcriptional regulator with PAS, ATPase and Fis domain
VGQALRTIDLEAVEQIQTYRSHKDSEETVLIGRSGGLSEVYRLVEMAAATDAPVLITGQTGVGKNVLAKTIHYTGASQKNAFVTINCAAIPENLIEDELFGHEKGAFTGAHSVRKGLFEMAEGGTLFLDEIGTLPLHLQSKLLGVLDDKAIRRIGGESVRPVDVRILAATNTEIEKAVANGTFREDLYYRLNVVRIHLPPLRERLQDIPDLSHFFVGQIAPDQSITVPDSEMERLQQYDWPGNIRELRNIIERAIILREGSVLRPSALLTGIQNLTIPPRPSSPDEPSLLSLSEVEEKHIRETLRRLSDNHTRAAKALGISRSTLKRKIKTYGIN